MLILIHCSRHRSQPSNDLQQRIVYCECRIGCLGFDICGYLDLHWACRAVSQRLPVQSRVDERYEATHLHGCLCLPRSSFDGSPRKVGMSVLVARSG